jgi:SOS response regulatory protein OraA/RecX
VLEEYLREKILSSLDRRNYARNELHIKMLGFIKLGLKKGAPKRLLKCRGEFDFGSRGAPAENDEQFLDRCDRTVQEILTRFEEVGLIDDLAYARAIMESEVFYKSRSPRLAAQKLKMKSLSESIVAQVVSEIDDDRLQENRELYIEKRINAELRKLAKTGQQWGSINFTARKKIISRLVGQASRQGINPSLVYSALPLARTAH